MQTGYKDAHDTETANKKISRPYTCYWVENEMQKKGLNLTKKGLKVVWNVSRLPPPPHPQWAPPVGEGVGGRGLTFKTRLKGLGGIYETEPGPFFFLGNNSEHPFKRNLGDNKCKRGRG